MPGRAMIEADVLIVGAGMAGASAGYELAAHGRVIVLEQEDFPGFHATGRSAALFAPRYGNAPVRALTLASEAFLEAPPQGFADAPILTPRGILYIASATRREGLATIGGAGGPGEDLEQISAAEALRRVPILRAEACAEARFDVAARDIDVDLLHQGYLRGLRARGGIVVTAAQATRLKFQAGRWTVTTAAGDYRAPIIVNAAGAWADHIATMAGLGALGLQPKQRTAVLIDPPADLSVKDWPCVMDIDETLYFKPDAGRLLASPADETDAPAGDVQAEELAVAIAVDRLEGATTLQVRRVVRSWAGLRTFAPDRTPVCGFDPRTEGFFWLAAQGGYGIQTAPALARTTSALIARLTPQDVDLDTVRALSPQRLRNSHHGN